MKKQTILINMHVKDRKSKGFISLNILAGTKFSGIIQTHFKDNLKNNDREKNLC